MVRLLALLSLDLTLCFGSSVEDDLVGEIIFLFGMGEAFHWRGMAEFFL